MLLAFYAEKPGAAKNSKKEIYGKYYTTIFDQEKINIEYILTPFELFKKINRITSELKKKKIQLSHASTDDGPAKKDLVKFVKANDYIFHATYYWLTAVKFIAARKGIDISTSSARKLEKLIPSAKRGIRKLVETHPELSPAELFKSDVAVEELKRIVQ